MTIITRIQIKNIIKPLKNGSIPRPPSLGTKQNFIVAINVN